VAVIVGTKAGEAAVGWIPLEMAVNPGVLLIERVGLNTFTGSDGV
jgi:hypothetical protein